MRTANIGRDLAGRGVYVAPWMGPDGEFVLLAITREKKLACQPVVVPIGSNHVLASDELWDVLERDDPLPDLKII